MMVEPSLKTVQADSANTCKGASVKSCGAERLQGVSKTELNESESSDDLSRERHPSVKTKESMYSLGQVVQKEPANKGITTSGIEGTRLFYRRCYGTWETALQMRSPPKGIEAAKSVGCVHSSEDTIRKER